jgi:hypothetical protein
LSCCLKKGFSSVVNRISTLAIGSRAHRSFQKRFISRKTIFLGIKKKSVFDRPFFRVAIKKVFQVLYIEFSRLPLVLGLIGLFKKGSLVEKNIFRDKKKIGVRSALFSRCHKKGFSSVIYRMFTLAVGSRAHRSFSKNGSAVEKKNNLGGGSTISNFVLDV